MTLAEMQSAVSVTLFAAILLSYQKVRNDRIDRSKILNLLFKGMAA